MAKEALQKITDAEAKGKALKAKAAENAANTEAKAKHDGDKLIADKISEAKTKAADMISVAEEKCAVILAEAKEKAIKNGEDMNKTIAANEASVIEGIIELLA